MDRAFTTGAILVFAAALASLGVQAQVALKDGIFTDATSGLRYTPPAGLTDETSDARELVRSRAAALHTNNTFDVLLRLISGPDDAVPEWHSISIESYPRSKFAGLDDRAAEAKINLWAAGAGASGGGSPEHVTFAGVSFLLSYFEQSEPPLLKYARVYSTIRNGKLLVIAFTANSTDKVKAVADTMQTLQFVRMGN